ncbi:hypothetical protein HDIA_0755 [Hartmannibacter diazotrophicus]|uniref:Uncharacterized protein n=1 Tax=Hartmannibacter diazotrophicus TaxID=1482074 RepID=A0A2C9D221_9HYPH|nr:hypothetical protein [Hartmannibacter diazotrophicus]SON54296.1 hypothetical protein HDIA_0755 [Hartmannibacter diazotrophicus]
MSSGIKAHSDTLGSVVVWGIRLAVIAGCAVFWIVSGCMVFG